MKGKYKATPSIVDMLKLATKKQIKTEAALKT